MKPTIAIMSPGDMGHAVGAALRQAGLRVITQLDGRSERTRALAARAASRRLATTTTWCSQRTSSCQSWCRPRRSRWPSGSPARCAGRALRRSMSTATPSRRRPRGRSARSSRRRRPLRRCRHHRPAAAAGASSTRYASGRDAAFARLADFGLDVRVLGDRPGQASALKMCYAALTKGTTALMTELSIAAERLGVSDALRAEFAESQPAMLERMQRAVPAMVPKAHRWVGEMARSRAPSRRAA